MLEFYSFYAVQFSSTTYWKDYLLSIVYVCLLCQRLDDNWCVGLPLDFLSRSIVLYFCFCARTILFNCYRFVVKSEVREPLFSASYSYIFLSQSCSGYSLEGMMLKLKLQYFGHLMQRVDSLGKTLMLGGIGAGGEGDDRGWDRWMASPTRWTWVWVNSGSWWRTGRPGVLQFMGSQRVGQDWATEVNWRHSKWYILLRFGGSYKLNILFFSFIF